MAERRACALNLLVSREYIEEQIGGDVICSGDGYFMRRCGPIVCLSIAYA